MGGENSGYVVKLRLGELGQLQDGEDQDNQGLQVEDAVETGGTLEQVASIRGEQRNDLCGVVLLYGLDHIWHRDEDLVLFLHRLGGLELDIEISWGRIGLGTNLFKIPVIKILHV